jgi:DNA-binding GntR family transcriptional regulator
MRLPEHQLAEIFDVSRERVRKVLQRLTHEKWLEIIPNRGAFVPKPTMADAREIVQARIVIEGGVIEQLVAHPKLIDRAALEKHALRESTAKSEENHVVLMHLTAEFHFLLAGFLKNQWISRDLEELVLRSLVFVSLFGNAVGPASCGPSEHQAIVRYLLAGDLMAARNTMVDHLQEMLILLDFRKEHSHEINLEDVLREMRSQMDVRDQK